MVEPRMDGTNRGPWAPRAADGRGRRPRRWWCCAAAAGVCALLAAAAAAPQDAAPAAPPGGPGGESTPVPSTRPTKPPADHRDATAAELARTPPAFVRRTTAPGGSRVVLEVASRTFRKGADGPTVSLVGVAHIGEADFYRRIQEYLDGHAKVLFESVMPAGAARPAGATPEARIASTRASMLFVRDLIERHRKRRGGEPPADLEAMAADAHLTDSRLEGSARAASVDAWGRPLRYRPEKQGFELKSLGADGQPGGDGEDADLTLRERRGTRVPESGDGIQSQLASLLSLSFQIDAMDYHRPGWEVADMTADQLSREAAERGLDLGPLQGSLAGSGLSGQAVAALVALLRVSDALTGGALADVIRMVLIETLSEAGDGSMLETLAPGFMDLILMRRNDVAMECLERTLALPEPPATIAVFYGAAHMPDLQRRLLANGWTPTGERWFQAMSIDLSKTALDRERMEELRRLVRRSLREAAKGAQ
ncbi:MAG: type II secretion system protein GspG [Phycisphaerales bacterium]